MYFFLQIGHLTVTMTTTWWLQFEQKENPAAETLKILFSFQRSDHQISANNIWYSFRSVCKVLGRQVPLFVVKGALYINFYTPGRKQIPYISQTVSLLTEITVPNTHILCKSIPVSHTTWLYAFSNVNFSYSPYVKGCLEDQ